MNGGSLAIDSEAKEAIAFYSNQINDNSFASEADESKPTIRSVVLNQDLLKKGHLEVNVTFSSPWELDPPLVGIVIYTKLGIPVLGSNTWLDPGFATLPVKEGTAKLTIKNLPLHSGNYKLSVWLGEKKQNYDSLRDVLQFEYISSTVLPQELSPDIIGALNYPTCWNLETK